MLELGQPLARVRSRRARGSGHRRATRGRRRAASPPSTTSIASSTPTDLLICDLRAAGRDRRASWAARRAEVSSDDDRRAARERVLHARRRPARRRDGSTCIPRRRTASSAAPTPRDSSAAADRCAAADDRVGGRRASRRAYAGAGATPARRWVSVRPARAAALLGYAGRRRRTPPRCSTRSAWRTARGGEAIEVEVPGYRTDIDHEVDLIEEIVRIQGYDRVGIDAAARAARRRRAAETPRSRPRVKDALVRAGLREIRPVPFVSQDDLDLFGDSDAVPVANPLRAEEGFLRTRLTPGLLHAPPRGTSRAGSRRSRCSRSARRFGWRDPFTRAAEARVRADRAGGRGLVRRASSVRRAGRDGGPRGGPRTTSACATGRWASRRARRSTRADRPRSRSAGRHAGVVGEIHPRVAAALEIDGRVAVVRARPRSGLARRPAARWSSRDVPRFPPVRRDLAFVVAGRRAGRCGRRRRSATAGAPDSTRCELFDVFAGPPLAEGTRSLAFALELREPDRTLTDEEAQSVVDRIVAPSPETSAATLARRLTAARLGPRDYTPRHDARLPVGRRPRSDELDRGPRPRRSG